MHKELARVCRAARRQGVVVDLTRSHHLRLRVGDHVYLTSSTPSRPDEQAKHMRRWLIRHGVNV